jgi:Protein of unknown function (DUF2842)
MTIRQRKLAGTIATIVFLTLYCLAAMAIGGAFIVGRSRLIEIAYFIVAGVAWLPVVMAIIRWMSRPDPI